MPQNQQKVMNDLNNVIFGVCEHNSVASAYYDELLGIYIRHGEKRAYEALRRMDKQENQFNNEREIK